jgi:hypothetical protein
VASRRFGAGHAELQVIENRGRKRSGGNYGRPVWRAAAGASREGWNEKCSRDGRERDPTHQPDATPARAACSVAWKRAQRRTTMTLYFRVQIAGEIHEVRVDVGSEPPQSEWPRLEEFAATTAWLEHSRLLPRGVLNAID